MPRKSHSRVSPARQLKKNAKWEKRKCRNKVTYHSWEAAERIDRLNTTSEGEHIFRIYCCPHCNYLHLTTRDKLRISARMTKILEDAA